MKLYWGKLCRRYRYIGLRVEPDPLGTKMLCLGFWWFHIYFDTGDKY